MLWVNTLVFALVGFAETHAGADDMRFQLPSFRLSLSEPALKARPIGREGFAGFRLISDGDRHPPVQVARASEQILSAHDQPNRDNVESRRGEARQTESAPPVSSDDSLQMLPIRELPDPEGVELNSQDDRVTLVATGADLPAVLRMIADHHGLNLVLAPDVAGPVTVSIRDAHLHEVLDAILGVAGFRWHQADHLLYVTGNGVPNMDPRTQGRTVQVYPLNFVASADLEPIINGMLSPVGKVFLTTANPADALRSRESLVVEDTAAVHHRIRDLIGRMDVAPQQVLVEAHVLQISLDDDQRHGVNLTALARLGGTEFRLSGTGFADADATPALAFSVDGTDMDALLECIRSNTNSRTLASPKVSVVNHQESKIQIGERLPYTVATTTQTTTVQSVEFLEVGIVLTVRPVIGSDGNVLMTVLPKVSGGKITAAGFPEEETTEVSTTIMIPDGGGIVIGGLIREEEVDTVAEVPGVSRVPLLGRLFRRTTRGIRRTELVIALVAHVLPGGLGPRNHEWAELDATLPPHARCDLWPHHADPTTVPRLVPPIFSKADNPQVAPFRPRDVPPMRAPIAPDIRAVRGHADIPVIEFEPIE